MKVIISRKGFDKTYGGGPSPIIDGERLVSLPIEYNGKERIRQYNDLRIDGRNLGVLLERLHPRRSRYDFCHLDPDLRQDMVVGRKNNRNWLPRFGQVDKAATHLVETHRIGEGDIFLFFGLVRASEGWNQLLPGAPLMHVVYAWFQVDRVI
jgi:hypothetical protein